MTEFTKGKWTADDMGEYVFAHGFNMMICQMRGWAYLHGTLGLTPDNVIEVQKANARLIAAAPDMYKLLKFFCEDKAIDEDRFDDYLVAIFEAKKLLALIDGDSQEVNS